MGRGILTVRDRMSFEDIDAMLGQEDGGFVTSYSQLDVPGMSPGLGPELGPSGPMEISPQASSPFVTSYSQLNTPSAPYSSPTPFITSYSQLGPLPSQAPPAAPAPDVMKSITSILTSGGQAYGSYSTVQAGKAASRSAAASRSMAPAARARTAIAPASTGLSPTTIALIAGGGILVVGIIVVLLVT